MVELLGKSFVQVGTLGDSSRFRLVGLVGQTLLSIELLWARPMQFEIQKTDVPEAESSWTEWFGESSFSSRSAVLLLTGPVESLGSS